MRGLKNQKEVVKDAHRISGDDVRRNLSGIKVEISFDKMQRATWKLASVENNYFGFFITV